MTIEKGRLSPQHIQMQGTKGTACKDDSQDQLIVALEIRWQGMIG